jgi:hypothetical protein
MSSVRLEARGRWYSHKRSVFSSCKNSDSSRKMIDLTFGQSLSVMHSASVFVEFDDSTLKVTGSSGCRAVLPCTLARGRHFREDSAVRSLVRAVVLPTATRCHSSQESKNSRILVWSSHQDSQQSTASSIGVDILRLRRSNREL